MENTLYKEMSTLKYIEVPPLSAAQELALLVRSTTIHPTRHTASSREALEAEVLSPARLAAFGRTCCLSPQLLGTVPEAAAQTGGCNLGWCFAHTSMYPVQGATASALLHHSSPSRDG